MDSCHQWQLNRIKHEKESVEARLELVDGHLFNLVGLACGTATLLLLLRVKTTLEDRLVVQIFVEVYGYL